MAYKVRYAAYLQLLNDGTHEFLKQSEYAEKLGVSERTIIRWDKKIDWEAIKSKRRECYAKRMVPVDDAMFKAAQKGNVAAAQYIAERFDGWVPTTAQLDLKNGDSELLERARQIKEQLRAGIGPDKSNSSETATA